MVSVSNNIGSHKNDREAAAKSNCIQYRSLLNIDWNVDTDIVNTEESTM